MEHSFDLTLRELEVFAAIAETGSVAGAAQRLRGSSSAISQQLTNLEETLGVRLVDRNTRPLTLTPAGQQLLLHADRILDAVTAAQADMMSLQLGSLPRFRLAIIDDLDATITPALVARMSDRHPTCHFIAWSGRSEEHRRSLIERECDVIITAEDMDDLDDVEVWPLLREPMVVVVAKAAAGDGSLTQLKAMPLVRYSQRMPLGREIERHLRRIRLSSPQRYEFDATHSVFAMVRESRGWALTTPLCWLDATVLHGDIELVEPPFATFTRTIVLAARRAELGGLPAELAAQCRRLIATECIPRSVRALPWLEGRMQVLGEGEGSGAV